MSKPSTKRQPLLKAHVGKELCSSWVAPNGSTLKVYVRGGKYGFSADLIGKTGQKLPVSTGNATTATQAMKNAKASLDRVANQRN